MEMQVSHFIKSDREFLINKLFEFKNICKINRTFPNCDYIEAFEQEMDNMVINISKDITMYRARIFKDDTFDNVVRLITQANNAKTEEDFKHVKQHHKEFETTYKTKIEKGFFGYDEKNSFINPNTNTIKAGRCNHDFETCLYTAEDPNTAISELKPLIKEKISVAKITTLEELKIIDLSFKFDDNNETFRNLIAMLFLTSPTETEKDAYLFTQVICSLVKKHGYDGIKYSSCQNISANNYAIFNYGKCKAISSDVYSVDNITYTCTKLTHKQ